uniref:Choline transporter-like protein n=1 Tax=Amphiprion ocellaris TaxID=80972 RepID=A0AAQ6A6E0_AMPOC
MEPKDKCLHFYNICYLFLICLFRSCTDILHCLIFTLVILSYVALGIVAWLHGDPRKMIHPTDSYGQFCGQKGTSNARKPILFYFNILKCTNPAVLINLQCPTTQMCVSQCPDKFATYTEMQLQHKFNKSYWEYYRQFCKPASQVLRDEDCPSMIVPSRPFLRRCLPDFITLNGTVTVANRTRFKDALEMPRSVTELQHAAKYQNFFSYILLEFLSLFYDKGYLTAVTNSLHFTHFSNFSICDCAGMWYCSTVWSQLRYRQGSEVAILEVGLQTDLQIYLQLRQTWIIFCKSVFFFFSDQNIVYKCRIVVFLTLWFLLSCRAISYIMSTLFFPVITFILLTICISYWGFIAIYLASSGEAVYKVMSPDVSCPYVNSTCNPETFYRTNISNSALCLGSKCLFAFYGGETSYHRCLFLLQLSNLFVFLWLVNFSLALEQCTLAGTFASYYWAKRKPQDIPPCPLFLSFNRAIRYHTGSLAFGALILSVAQLFRIILEYLEQRLKCVDNTLSRFLLCCLKCCFWCLEKFLRYMNCNAYIMVAIYGKNFCTSAREAFFLLMRNAVRVAVLDRLTDFLLFLGKVLIAGGVGVVAFFFFTNKIPVIQEEVPSLNYYWVPILTVVIGAYLIAHSFFSIYAMCVDTLFLCFCDDLERNDGSSNKPYFMSPELHRILGKSNQIQ